MRRPLIPFFAFITFLTACRTGSNPATIDAINENLEQGRSFMHKVSEQSLTKLKELSVDPMTAAKASVWLPKVQEVSRRSFLLFQLLDSLKKELVADKANGRKGISQWSPGKSRQLFDSIHAYVAQVPNAIVIDTTGISPVYKEYLEKDLRLMKKMVAAKFALPGDTAHPDQLSVDEGILLISSLQSRVADAEQLLAGYCRVQIGSCCFYYDKYTVIALLNAERVKAGQPIEVVAGYGAFEPSLQCRVAINGVFCETGPDGVATSTFRAAGKPGTYTVPVSITCTMADSTVAVYEKNLTYTIAQ